MVSSCFCAVFLDVLLKRYEIAEAMWCHSVSVLLELVLVVTTAALRSLIA